MDFSWEALESAQTRLRRLRQRMAAWSAEANPDELSSEAAELDRRFRDAVADDLDMPRAIEILSEAVNAAVPDGDKHRLLTSWDAVLGLDLERAEREGQGGLPDDVAGPRDPSRRGPRRPGTSPRRTSSATSSPGWATRSWTPPREPGSGAAD